MIDYSDRRQEARKIVMAFTLVYDLKKGNLLGYLRDLTVIGARISGKKKQEVNTQVTLSIELPNDLPGVSAERLNIEAKVAHCITISGEIDSYDIGFKFTDLQPEEMELIEKLLERYHFRPS